MKYAIIDVVNVEDLKNADDVKSVNIINAHGVAGGNPTVRIGIKII